MISRDDALATLSSQEFDVVVVGGGITGAGCALDAASRGMSVALIEKDDFASGTSSRSSKLVHGGLRYLQSFDLGLVREALLERRLLVDLAPHLVRPLPLVVPAFDGERGDRAIKIGLSLYDVMSVDARSWRRRGRAGAAESWSPDRHHEIDGDEVVRLLPALAGRNPTSGFLFYDCQTDDSRLVLTILGEAERFGAVCSNRLRAAGLLESHGWVRGVRVQDAVGGGEFEIRATSVVNATGVWADRLRPEQVVDDGEVPHIAPSRGTHVTFSRQRLPIDAGVIVPAGGERTIFALPWLGATLVGTTDNDYASDDLDRVAPPGEDIDYLLDACNSFFGTGLERSDVQGAFAGLRPLISTGDSRKSVDISRRAELYETASGMVTITGGKLTTWRRMAKQAIDRVVERQERDAPCRTDQIPLGRPIAATELPDVAGVPLPAREALAARYGDAADAVLRLAEQDPALAEPIVDGGSPDLLAEAAYSARSEQALSVGDVLLRRTRLALIAGRAVTGGDGVALRVAGAMAGVLGWDDVRVRQEADRFLREAETEGVAPNP